MEFKAILSAILLIHSAAAFAQESETPPSEEAGKAEAAPTSAAKKQRHKPARIQSASTSMKDQDEQKDDASEQDSRHGKRHDKRHGDYNKNIEVDPD